MQTIEFRLVRVEFPAALASTVLPHVDGLPLTDLVRRVELPFARAGGDASLAGSYAGLAPEDVAWPSRHFLGEPALEFEPEFEARGLASQEEWNDSPHTVLLGCGCGEWSCWPLAAKIRVEEDVVVWSDVRHGFRDWDYAALRPLVFARSPYEQALRATAR